MSGQGCRIRGRLELCADHLHVAKINGESDHAQQRHQKYGGQDGNRAATALPEVSRASVSWRFSPREGVLADKAVGMLLQPMERRKQT